MGELRENHDFGSFMVIWPEYGGTKENDDFGSFMVISPWNGNYHKRPEIVSSNELYRPHIGYMWFKYAIIKLK